MRLYPAIDVRGGKCVRLRQGQFDDCQIYSDTPSDIAKEWEDAKASYIHVVDLDGALKGQFVNKETIRSIVEAVKIPVQMGGGIRSIADIEERLNLGISRVIIGTKAVASPAFVKEVIEKFGADKIVIGIDAKDGMAATHGWEEVSEVSAVSLALTMKECGVKTIVYTDIAKDGMLAGPNVSYTMEMVQKTGLDIIASGGVSSMEDLDELEKTGAGGAILGKSLYEKKINLAEAVLKFEPREMAD